MHNYPPIQRFLHQIVLSSKIFKKTCFEFEKKIFLGDKYSLSDNHVFITGLARSGTTVLLNSIYESDKFASLTYRDMPFVLAPNYWSKINFNPKNDKLFKRMHDDGLLISYNSPEAFEEVFWKTFSDKNKKLKTEFISYIKLILLKNKKSRYLSKNNQNVNRIGKIQNYLPNSKIFILFRYPLDQAYSLLCQHDRFLNIHKKNNFIRNYMKWIGHSEFGMDYSPIVSKNLKHKNYLKINHWLEQWKYLYQELLQSRFKDNLYFICYEKLCNERLIWSKIQSLLGINNSVNFVKKEKNINLKYDINLNKSCLEIYNRLVNKHSI